MPCSAAERYGYENKNTVVAWLVSKKEVQAAEIDRTVKKTFEGRSCRAGSHGIMDGGGRANASGHILVHVSTATDDSFVVSEPDESPVRSVEPV